MKTFAYCAHSFEQSTKRAAGVQPLLSPPSTIDTFEPAWLESHNLIYFKLHGLPGQPFWYGDKWVTALSTDQIRSCDLTNTIIFVANCYLPESPMLQALLDAGAKAVIGGPGQNYARPNSVDGADLLGLYVRVLLQLGFSAAMALRFAKTRLHLKRKDKETKDTLAFRIWNGAV